MQLRVFFKKVMLCCVVSVICHTAPVPLCVSCVLCLYLCLTGLRMGIVQRAIRGRNFCQHMVGVFPFLCSKCALSAEDALKSLSGRPSHGATVAADSSRSRDLYSGFIGERCDEEG